MDESWKPIETTMLIDAEQMRKEIIYRHIKAGQYATGRTSGMLRIQPTESGFQLIGWKYSGTYEEGRKPGGMPDVDAIITWMQAKGIGINDRDQLTRYAWAIARKIAKQGTKRYRDAMQGNKVDIFETPFAEMKQKLQEQILFFTTEEVKRTLNRLDLQNGGSKI